MNIIGKPPINPILFFSGKTAGYIIWALLFLEILGKGVVSELDLSFNKPIAHGLLIVGLIISLTSIFILGRSIRMGLPFEETKLKTHGLYRFSRNPIYLGFNLLSLASMIYFLNVWVAFLGIFNILTHHQIIRGEEKFLKKRFGAAYLGYKKKVGRYF
jgi:protein-S-isoprenylcysteine O-methyltransferase Ste14